MNRDTPQDLERRQCVLQRPSLQVPGCHGSAETSSEAPAHLDRIKPEVNRGTRGGSGKHRSEFWACGKIRGWVDDHHGDAAAIRRGLEKGIEIREEVWP